MYTRYSVMFPKVLLTNNLNAKAEERGIYWLMDIIASKVADMARSNPRLNEIQFWKLEKKGKGAKVECRIDSGFSPSYTQKVGYTDFSEPSIDIWAAPQYIEKTVNGQLVQEKFWILMLPEDY